LLKADALLLAPFKPLSRGDSGYVDFTAGDFGVADYRLSALRRAVDHKAAPLGLALALGAGWQF
jgi:hypothetical protein